jgi:RNA polymerase sigma-70 factor (ECF subfamily)
VAAGDEASGSASAAYADGAVSGDPAEAARASSSIEATIDDDGRRTWQELYERHAGDILRYLVKLTGDREAGAELVQETFARAMRAGLDGVASPRAWLFRIASNLACDRHRARVRGDPGELTGDEIDDRAVFDVEVDLIHRALASLALDDAIALLLRFDAGLTNVEVAEHEGVSEEAMKSRLRRAKERFMAEYFRQRRGDR